MNYNQQLLQKFMEATGMNLSESAKAIGIAQPNLSKIRHGENKFTNEQLLRIAEIIGERDEIVLVKSQLDRAKSDKERNAWVKLLMSSAASVTMTIGAINQYIANCAQCIFIAVMRYHSYAL